MATQTRGRSGPPPPRRRLGVTTAIFAVATAISEAARELGMPGYEIAYGYVYVWEEDPGLG